MNGWELSWPMVGGVPFLPECQKVSLADYDATISKFDPSHYDPRSLARLCKRLGMRYAVLTTKHHDGFALFDTQLSDRSTVRTRCGRDLVGPYVQAFRDEGLKVGVYFSLSDWSHPDYPAFTEADKPYDFFRLPQPTPVQWERYLAFLFGQVRELLTQYGQIDLIWFDGHWERLPPAQWKPAELRALIKSLQPGILINDRLPGAGDFDTPEQFVPHVPPTRAWETCLTMNESWAHHPGDTRYKSARKIVHTLCEVAGHGGNLLLNVSPTADGTLPAEQLERLHAVAGWMEHHQQSIVDTTPGFDPTQFYGPSTRRGDTYYLHLLSIPYESVQVRGIPIRRVRNVRALGSGMALEVETRCSIVDGMFNHDPRGELTIHVPREALDPLATVIAFELTR